MVSYALSRMRFKARKPIMNIMLILGMFPGFMSMIAVYFILKAVNLNNSLVALILVYSAGAALSYYICKGFFDTIPRSLEEAAILDGASQLTILFRVTLPLVTPMIFYNLVMNIIGGLQIFAQVYLLTNGGPLQATTTVVMLIYRYGLTEMEMGLASAMAWILAVIIMVLTAITFITRKFWVYSEE